MDQFQTNTLRYLEEYKDHLSTENGDWIVKGFIDLKKNIYTISVDTKVVSKIIELMIFPIFQRMADENGYQLELCDEQNHYPDVTFVTKEGKKYALDIKSTYRKGENKISGLTLGAFSGYFRNRSSHKNIKFPYNNYEKHYILAIIYSRQDEKIDERKIYDLSELEKIVSVVKDFEFIVQEKYKIAVDRPGSGNTKNIGSVTNLDSLRNGIGPFTALGVKVFDDYWMNYMTKQMAKDGGLLKPPYSNLNQYLSYRNINELKQTN